LHADLAVHAAAVVAPKIVLETDAGNVLRIEEMKSTSPTVLRYRIKLNVHSALTWHELLDRCNISVKNTLTGQTEVIPVKVVLHGDASKAVLHASDTFFGVIGTFLESTIVQVCASLFTAAFIAILIGWHSQLVSPGARSMLSPELSALSRTSRSGGGPEEPLLWSISNGALSQSELRRRHQMYDRELAFDDDRIGFVKPTARISPTSSPSPSKMRKDNDDAPYLFSKFGSSRGALR
uniref:PHM7_ext domain-containing protein n=1 Tax=Gongylonema pulchrum TaxID=637853 RepID=A0A183ELG2_9BILA